MNKRVKRIAILLILALLAPAFLSFVPSMKSLTTAEVSAATTRSKLGINKLTIGVNSSPEYVYIENYDGNATYTYSSSNKKVAVIGEYGTINGVSKGKATITVTEVLNGTETELGKIAISVVGAALYSKELKVGVKDGQYIFVNYSNNKAEYKFKSADTKTATVDKFGCVTGVKKGKTTISVTEILNGKTTKLGSVTVSVISAELAEKEFEVPVNQVGYYGVYLKYQNPDAVYKYKSAYTKILTVDKYGLITGIKVGSTTISVTETYNKKTVDVGTVKINVVEPYLDPVQGDVIIGINSSNYISDIAFIKYLNWEATYTCEAKDSSIVSTGYEENIWGDTNFKINGVSLGTTTLTIYETVKKVKRELGTIFVTVKEIPLNYFGFDSYAFEEVNGLPTKTFILGENSFDSIMYFFYTDPYNTTVPKIYTSNDEKIVTVDNQGVVTPVGPGTTTITASCGDTSYQLQVIVKETE